LLPSTDFPLPSSVSEHVFSVAKTSVYFLVFPKNEPLVFLVSFGPGRAGRYAGAAAQVCRPILPADLAGCTREVAGCARDLRELSRNVQRTITECERRY
jgi:hypothetical protein